MRLEVIGYNEYSKRPFSYYVDNVVSISKVLDVFIVQFIDNEQPKTTSFKDDGLTHLFLDVNGYDV